MKTKQLTEIRPGLNCDILAAYYEEDGSGYVLCKSDRDYVTWWFDAQGHTHSGHYFGESQKSKTKAFEYFSHRVAGIPLGYVQRLETTNDRALWVVYSVKSEIKAVHEDGWRVKDKFLDLQHMPGLKITPKEYSRLKKKVKKIK